MSVLALIWLIFVNVKTYVTSFDDSTLTHTYVNIFLYKFYFGVKLYSIECSLAKWHQLLRRKSNLRHTVYLDIHRIRKAQHTRGRSYVGTLYIRASRARKNSTRIQHTVLLFKLISSCLFFLSKSTHKFTCAPFIEYRHRFLSFFFHSNHFRHCFISLVASLNIQF